MEKSLVRHHKGDVFFSWIKKSWLKNLSKVEKWLKIAQNYSCFTDAIFFIKNIEKFLAEWIKH